MKKLVIVFILLFISNAVFAATAYKYDNRGHKIGTYKTQGNITREYNSKGQLQYKYVHRNNTITKYSSTGRRIKTIKQRQK